MKQRKTRNSIKIGVAVSVIMMLMMLLPVMGAKAASNFETAVAITLDTRHNGEVTQSEQVNYYKFDLSSAGRIGVDLECNFDNIWFGVQVYSSDKKVLFGKTYYSSRNNFSLELDKGTYYIKFVGSYDESDNSECFGKYNFKIDFTSASVNHTEPNNSIDTSVGISFGSIIKGHIAQNNDIDYYKFTLPSAGRIGVDLECNFDDIWFGIQVYSSDKKVLFGKTYFSNRNNFSLELDKGTYYIKFVGNYDERDNSEYFGKYNFKINFISAGVNHAEPNNSIDISARISLGSNIKGHIAQNNDIDYYKLTLPSTGYFKVSLESNVSGILGIQVFNSDRKAIHEITYHSSGRQNFELELFKGTYYIKFVGNYHEHNNSNNFGNYNFKTTFKKFIKPNKVKLSSVKKSGLSATAKWKRIKAVDGYQLIYSTKKSFKGKKSIIVSGNYTKNTVYWLKNKKTYYFKVRAYKKFNEKTYYGSYGNVKKVKIKLKR